MIVTRVGYAGGKKENPTYESLGDHTEVIQIEYDAKTISYEELLRKFFEFHNPARQSMTRQYMSIIFYHNEEQYKIAIKVRDEIEKQKGIEILTEMEKYEKFYLAEFYHQKYYLQGLDEAMELLKEKFQNPQEFLDSPVVTKLNGAVISVREDIFMEKLKELLNI